MLQALSKKSLECLDLSHRKYQEATRLDSGAMLDLMSAQPHDHCGSQWAMKVW